MQRTIHAQFSSLTQAEEAATRLRAIHIQDVDIMQKEDSSGYVDGRGGGGGFFMPPNVSGSSTFGIYMPAWGAVSFADVDGISEWNGGAAQGRGSVRLEARIDHGQYEEAVNVIAHSGGRMD